MIEERSTAKSSGVDREGSTASTGARASTQIARTIVVALLIGCAAKDATEPEWNCTNSVVQHHPAYTTFTKIHHYHRARNVTICTQWTRIHPVPDTLGYRDGHRHYTVRREGR